MRHYGIKLIIIVFIQSFCFRTISAQVKFGIKGGYNLADIPIPQPDQSSQNHLSGFNAGILAAISLKNHFFLQPELAYSQQGTIITIHTTEDQRIKFSYNYLNLPVLIKYQHASGLFAETGPQLGILSDLKFVYGNEGQSTNRTYTQPLDFAWTFGLGYQIPKINLGFDIRYNLGLTDIDRYGLPDTYSSNNRVLQVGFLYFFKHI